MVDSTFIQNTLLRARELIQLGFFEAAESSCRQLLEVAPRQSEGWHHLGFLALRRGAPAEAEAALRQAVLLDASYGSAWNNLAIALRRLGQLEEAEVCARRAVACDPLNAANWQTLGAILSYRRQWAEAREIFTKALELDPLNAEAWSNLGGVEQELQQFEIAQRAYERSLKLSPNNSSAMANYAALLNQRGQLQEAVALLDRAVEIDPNHANAWAMLGNIWRITKHFADAERCLRQTLSIAPRHSGAALDLALVLYERGRLTDAETCIRQLLGFEPGDADAWSVLGLILLAEFRTDEAVAAHRRSWEIKMATVNLSAYLHALNYVDDVDAAQLRDEHRRWEVAFGQTLRPSWPQGIARPNASHRLRFGFVSGDFGEHPVGHLALCALECLDKTECSVTCYSNRFIEDAYTARFRAVADTWRPTNGLSVEELAEKIRADRIDILFDLAGHLSGNHVAVFARKPAPVQVTWLGYVGTTGLEAMDYLLADRFHVREGEEQFYTEKILRMPNGYACYGPPEDAPEVGRLPALRNATAGLPSSAGRVTFGCFNNPAKYAPSILAAWAEILRRVPGSRLLLKYAGLDDPQVQRRLRGEFAQRHVEVERILLEGWSPHCELLSAYNRVDLALDTQPYSGGLTTCEALWMGVPVITYPGKTFAGRHSVSHLMNAGYPQFVAADAAGYVELAVQWASRLDELAVIRAQMRERVRNSPLCDAPRFAHDFLAVLRKAWEAQTLA